ncbi:retrovirus-related pol polyprotein from transposon TNT 1-94 [Tanacetum coccineum]
MANMSEDIQCAGSNTHLPMLDKTDFESWQQRIREDGTLHLGPERDRVFADLTPEEKERFQADIHATNILLQWLPKDIYSLINHYTDAKDIWDNVKMPLEGETIHDYYVRFSKLINDMRNIKMTIPKMQLNSKFLYAYLKQHEVHSNENKMMLQKFSQLAADPLALVSDALLHHYSPHSSSFPQAAYQPPPPETTHLDSRFTLTDNLIERNQNRGPGNRGQGNNARGVVAVRKGGVLNRGANANQGQAKPIKCYNFNGIGYMQDNNGVVLDEEHLLFIDGGQDNTFDDDVDEAPVQDLALNQDNVFQADECDAFDSDVDEAPTDQSMFMENLSSIVPIYDEAGPSYDSDIISEVQDHDICQDNVDEHHLVHEMQNDVQPNGVVDSIADHASDSNVISYEQYVKDNEVEVVQSNVSYVPNDALMTTLNDMHEKTAKCVYNNEQNIVVNDSLTAELARYKELVGVYETMTKFELTAREQKIDEQMRIIITDRNIQETSLKSELHTLKMQLKSTIDHNKYELVKTSHVLTIVRDSEDTLETAEITRKEMLAKMKSPLWTDHRIKIAPPDYSKENFLATFTPQRQILPAKSQVKINLYTLTQLFTEFDKTCKKRITPCGLTKGERGFEQTKECYLTEVIPFFKTLKQHFEGIQTALVKEVKEMKEVFEQMESEVDQNTLDKQCAEIERKNLLIDNENLLADCLSKDVMYSVMTSVNYVSHFSEMHDAYTVEHARCLALEYEILNLKDKIQKDDHAVMIKRFSELEMNHLNLQIKYQNLKESIGNIKSQPSRESPEFDLFFELNKKKEQIQEKNKLIRDMKEQISQFKMTTPVLLIRKESNTRPPIRLNQTPQQNGVVERKNRTLIEAARTMLVDSFLPNTFWAEAVSTACYVLNRVLMTKPQNKTPYKLITGKIPIISYIRPFGCHVTILNTIDHLGKFDGKSDEGFLVGYSLNSKAFRVYNLETKRVEENLHITILENKPNVAGKGPNWLFDLDYLTDSMNYQPVRSENQANKHAGPKEANHIVGTQDNIDAGNSEIEAESAQDYFVLPIWSSYTSTVKSSEAKNEGEKSTKNTDLKTNEKPVDQEDQTFLDKLERLKGDFLQAEEEATKVALIRDYDDIQARIEADSILATRLQEEEREKFTIEERAKLLHDTIAAQRRFLTQQRAAEIRSRPPIRTQLRNQMMTYLKHVGGKKHSDLKTKNFEEIQVLYEKVKRSDENFITIGYAEDERLIKDVNKKAIGIKKDDNIKEESKEKETIDEDKEVEYEILNKKYPIIEWKTEYLGTKPQFDETKRLEEINLNVESSHLEATKGLPGVHTLMTEAGLVIHMLVEKKYPLRRKVLLKMMELKLESEEDSTMALELIRFVKKLIAELEPENSDGDEEDL